MNKKIILRKFLLCQIFLFSLFSTGLIYAQTGPSDDFDGDGIVNSSDIDDDNDGVPDAEENPACFYSAAEISVPASITTTVSNSGTIANLYDNNPSTVFNFTNGTGKTNLTVFEITPIQPVAASGIQIEMNFDSQTEFSNTANSLTIEGWNGSAWVTLKPSFNPSSAPNAVLGYFQTFNFTQNQNTVYSKFRLQGLAGGIIGSQMKEVKLLIPGNYVASLHPKPSCTDANIDGDNILNHFDLDSDGDGCSDALESGATAITTANYQFPDTDSNNDGLVDAVDSDNDGIPDYESTYINYAIMQSLNECSDSDGDGIKDLADLDDDNDGIPDITECPTGVQNIISGGVKNLTETLPLGVNPSDALYDEYGLIIRERSKVAPYNLARNEFNIVSHLGDSDNEYISQTGPIAQSFEFYNPVFNQKRSVDSIQISAESATDGSTLTLVAFDDIDNVIYTGTFPDGSTMSVNTSQTLNNSKIHRFIVFGSNDSTAFDHLLVQGLSTFAGSCDTDGDNIANHLDLDSDGDGCPDLIESGVSPATDVSTPSSETNNNGQSYGIDPAKLNGSQLDPLATDENNDGLNDSVDKDASNAMDGKINYASTYDSFALSDNWNLCTDTDGDSIIDLTDIDDDNDGVLDAVESPDCFYTSTEVRRIIVKISSKFSSDTTDSFSLLHNGTVETNTTSGFNFTTAIPATTNTADSNIFTIEYLNPIELSSVNVSQRISDTAAARAHLWGSVDGTTWIQLTTTAVNINTNSERVFPVQQNQGRYKYYQIRTSVAGNIPNSYFIGEITGTPVEASFVPSSYPKPDCSNDTDNDGFVNHHDLDSDGDRCSDAIESGVSSNSGASGSMSTSGGNLYSGGIAPGTVNAYVGDGSLSQYGSNGYFNDIETNSESNVYNGTYTYSDAVDAAVAECSVACYRPAVTSGTVLDTEQGITSLQRAGKDNSNWPMVRKGAWTALESKTKGFVMNRLSTAQINAIPADDLVEGMMVYNIDLDCLYINTDGTEAGWKCFNTQACPD